MSNTKPITNDEKNHINALSGKHSLPFWEAVYERLDYGDNTFRQLIQAYSRLYDDGHFIELMSISKSLFLVCDLPFPIQYNNLSLHDVSYDSFIHELIEDGKEIIHYDK